MEDENKNPHYVTPEEASDIGCPMTMSMHIDESSYGQGCQGPKCMAWRWKLEKYWEANTTLDGTFSSTVEKKRYSTTHGYCGMVRHG